MFTMHLLGLIKSSLNLDSIVRRGSVALFFS